MIPELRKQFNQRWNSHQYLDFLKLLDEISGTHVGFRCSETPIFLPNDLVDKMIRYGRELYAQLAENANYRSASDAAIPPEFRAPNEDQHPLFVQADFGLVRQADETLEPKLVEIQGFPSLYAFQVVMARQYRLAYDIHGNWTTFLGGLHEKSYLELLKRAIVAEHDPNEVVLLEIDPYQQKTLCDFLLTSKQLGIRIADVKDIKKDGRKLSYEGIPVKRIYNRVIADEVARKDAPMGFSFTDDLDVEWAGHPNWFFRLSKFSIPWFRHECVPESLFLDKVDKLPDDLAEWVLKPLYSFAGLGVKIAPAKEEIDAIPPAERKNFILQRKMDFVPTLETPSGPTKVEIRIMYIRDEGELKPATTVIRTGRGKMMGVDFNKNLDWVGASAGFHFSPK